MRYLRRWCDIGFRTVSIAFFLKVTANVSGVSFNFFIADKDIVDFCCTGQSNSFQSFNS